MGQAIALSGLSDVARRRRLKDDRLRHHSGLRWLIAAWLSLSLLLASEYRGQVNFGGLPVPGATVTATHDGKKFFAVTDQQGLYSFSNLPDGTYSIAVSMSGFSPLQREVAVTPKAAAAVWDLQMLPLGGMNAAIEINTPQTDEQPTPDSSEQDLAERAADGLLINGSINNGAASPFAQSPVFGNNRKGSKGLYNGGIGLTFDNSALDARPFSLTGQNTPKVAYNRMTGLATLGGPLKIPQLLPNGPNFFVGYQWTRNRDATTQSALMPTERERSGIFSRRVLDPRTGLPFPGNTIPEDRISAQARALLRFYPHPNFAAGARYNYQIPIISPTHQDALESRLSKTVNNKNQVYGGFALQDTRADSPNLFGFLDTTDILGINTHVDWSHRVGPRLFLNAGYQFSRLATRVRPFFENRENVSGQAGISGNNQDPLNWGPPALVFSSGIAGVSDAQSAFNRNLTSGVSYSMLWNRNAHNVMFGADFRREQFNYLSQQDPRGTFTFTGAAAGSDFAGFLLGVPDTSAIAFGNADKYFRESVYDAYLTDDWRVSPEFTLNAGLRWEYGAPITELYGRLVNLDIAPGFSAVAPVVATDPIGALTGQQYPDSLIHPDKNGFEPRIGIAWRPVSGSSLVVRAGYGVYYNTSVYQNIAIQMAQQSPLSKSLSVQNSPADPLTLADGFKTSASITPNTFAIDPHFRVGYAQNWQMTVQRDLPGSLQLTAEYLGIKGTRGMQEFLPNTFPTGAINPCPACPAGYIFMTSNGNSTREAAQIQLRRRLHNGLAATLQYTFSKSIDDVATMGGQGAAGVSQTATMQNPFSPITAAPAQNAPSAGAASTETSQASASIAQNWLDLKAERALSDFDQRHDLSFLLQYTTGMGLRGGTLLTGWKGALLKEWTFATQITAAGGLPLTPVYLAAVQGTGVTGSIRPNYTGAPLYAAPRGFFLNPAAYTAPLPGQWGNAGRNSITGPAQFVLNASMGRTFRLNDRFNLDLRIDSTNALNHVTFTAWNTTVTSAQFGLPASANAMRSLQTTLRVRF